MDEMDEQREKYEYRVTFAPHLGMLLIYYLIVFIDSIDGIDCYRSVDGRNPYCAKLPRVAATSKLRTWPNFTEFHLHIPRLPYQHNNANMICTTDLNSTKDTR